MPQLVAPSPVPATIFPELQQATANSTSSGKAIPLAELTEGDILTSYPEWFRSQRQQLASFFTLSGRFAGHGFPLPLPNGYPYNLATHGIKLSGNLPAPRYYSHAQLVKIMEGYIEGTRAAELSYRKALTDTGQVSIRTLQRWCKATREKAKEHVHSQRSKWRYQDVADSFPLKVTLAMLTSGETSNRRLAQLTARSEWTAVYTKILSLTLSCFMLCGKD